MIAKNGNQNLPDLLPKLATPERWTFTENMFIDRCRLRYDEESRMPRPKEQS